MIDTQSPPGSYASILPYCTQIDVSEYDSFADQLEHNLARRRAARLERNPHKRGWITRGINAR